MTMQNRPMGTVEDRKAAMRKHANIARTSLGVAAVSAIVGVVLIHTMLLYFWVPLIALGVGGYNAYKARQIVNHKDNW